jgi:hypothetical protein
MALMVRRLELTPGTRRQKARSHLTKRRRLQMAQDEPRLSENSGFTYTRHASAKTSFGFTATSHDNAP